MPLLALAAAATLLFSPVRMPPIDECSSDKSFDAFRSELRKTVARRDGSALTAILSKDVLADFGGGEGRKEFARIWKLSRPKSSPIWAELERALRLGCSMAHGSPAIPYLAEGFTSEDDLFDKMVVVEPGATMREQARENAKPIARLDYHVVQVGDVSGQEGWVLAKLADGRRGYIRRDQLRSALDYRAGFQKRGGRWFMTSFVQGD
jgi:hypothetical protein